MESAIAGDVQAGGDLGSKDIVDDSRVGIEQRPSRE